MAERWNAERRAADPAAPPLPVKLSVAWGRVTVGAVGDGAVGDGDWLDFTVIGDPVNLVAKLEKLNKTEGVRAICAVEAWEAARAQGHAPAVEPECRRDRPVPDTDRSMDLVVQAA